MKGRDVFSSRRDGMEASRSYNLMTAALTVIPLGILCMYVSTLCNFMSYVLSPNILLPQ